MEVTERGLPSDFPTFKYGWLVGTMVVDRSEALAERPDQIAGQARNDKGLVVGGDGGIECGWSAGGGKAPAAYRGTG